MEQTIILILMRLYDIQLAQLMHMNPGVATKLIEQHQQGKILSDHPIFTEFMSNNILDEESEENADEEPN